MEYSKHNIFTRLADSDEHFLVNMLSRQADILDAETAAEYRDGSLSDPDAFIAKGYLVDPTEEESRYRLAYLDFLEARDDAEVQLFFVPTYACNFSCPYCYQDGYGHDRRTATPEMVDAFFAYVDRTFTGRSTYITIFGGEPLLPGNAHRKLIRRIVDRANERHIGLAFVTNGYLVEEYLPILETANIREIQITLDGVGDLHDHRRPHRGGAPTFDRIVAGIDALLDRGIPVNLP